MASHKKHAQPTTFALPGKSQMVKIVATVAAVGLLATGGIVSHNLYATAEKSPAKQVTAYSVTDSIEASVAAPVRRFPEDTSYVTVKINGKTRVVPGMHFTDVKSVLDAGDITLDTEDTVSPSLDTKVNENTVIKIERAGASVEVSDTDIAFNTVKKETSSLPKGQEKVETEGTNGVMETTNLVTKSGGKVMSSNTISSFVKKARPTRRSSSASARPRRPRPQRRSAPPCRLAKCSSGLTIICCPAAIPRPISPPPCTSFLMSPVGMSQPRTQAPARTVCRRRCPVRRW